MGRSGFPEKRREGPAEDPVRGKIIDKNFAFTFRATDPGQLKVTFTDTTGGKYEGTADVTFS